MIFISVHSQTYHNTLSEFTEQISTYNLLEYFFEHE
jgi:hypothetical protein